MTKIEQYKLEFNSPRKIANEGDMCEIELPIYGEIVGVHERLHIIYLLLQTNGHPGDQSNIIVAAPSDKKLENVLDDPSILDKCYGYYFKYLGTVVIGCNLTPVHLFKLIVHEDLQLGRRKW